MYDLVVVSSYPPKGQIHGSGTVGVASYAKNTLLHLPKTTKILVLAEILTDQPSQYQEDNITIIRCWHRNSLFLYFQIIKELIRNQTPRILFEFEMAMFGHPALNILFPFLIGICSLFSKTHTVLHQVVLNFGDMSGHLGKSKDSFITKALSLLSLIFYKLVILFSGKIIVFEQFLKNRLSPNNSKIIIIPHGVETIKKTDITYTSRKSKFFTVTSFGFLAWYKGTDWIVKAFDKYLSKHPRSNLKLLIAGGPNPNHLDKQYYQDYLNNLNIISQKHPDKIKITGFVAEKDIASIYQQSNLLIFPYRAGMSSSGPLSLAFSYSKPFIVSKPLSPLLLTSDIADNIKKYSLNTNQITFNLNQKSLFNKLIRIQKDTDLSYTIAKAGHDISQSRSWENIGNLYCHALNLK